MLDCNSEECITARGNLVSARNEINSLCAGLALLRAALASATTMAAIYGAMAAAMLALAVVWAAFSGFGLGIIAVAFAGLGLVFLGIQAYFLGLVLNLNRQISEAEIELDEARKDFQSAVSEILKNCPSECWGDLVMPLC